MSGVRVRLTKEPEPPISDKRADKHGRPSLKFCLQDMETTDRKMDAHETCCRQTQRCCLDEQQTAPKNRNLVHDFKNRSVRESQSAAKANRRLRNRALRQQGPKPAAPKSNHNARAKTSDRRVTAGVQPEKRRSRVMKIGKI
jgi:hypothetical protein